MWRKGRARFRTDRARAGRPAEPAVDRRRGYPTLAEAWIALGGTTMRLTATCALLLGGCATSLDRAPGPARTDPAPPSPAASAAPSVVPPEKPPPLAPPAAEVSPKPPSPSRAGRADFLPATARDAQAALEALLEAATRERERASVPAFTSSSVGGVPISVGGSAVGEEVEPSAEATCGVGTCG